MPIVLGEYMVRAAKSEVRATVEAEELRVINGMTGARVFLTLVMLVSSSGCVFWPHRGPDFNVSGEVHDNHRSVPIADAKIELLFPETKESGTTQTSSSGQFTLESEGKLRWILWFWADELPNSTPVELKVSHPEYESQFIDDLQADQNEDHRILDAGYLYLERKR